jgi:hypothetical protein
MVNLMVDSNLELWKERFPETKMPGTEEPEDGTCGARLRSKELKELGIIRYCGNKAGKGTTHLGTGTCKFHGGSTPQSTKNAVQVQAQKEMVKLSEQLGEAPGIGNPEIEAYQLASKMKQWTLILEHKMDELNDILATVDDAGVEHVRALVEILERAWERYKSALEFMLKYDLRKRVLELEEHQARLVGQAFMAIILNQSMKLDEDQIDLARNLFAKQMEDLGAKLEPSWAAGVTIDAEVIE